MRPLSLDLRGQGTTLALSQQATGRTAGASFLMHGLAITTLLLVPLLGSTNAPEPAGAFLGPLIAPIRVALPPPPRTASRAPSAATRPQPAHAVVAPIDAPNIVPLSIVNISDVPDAVVGPDLLSSEPGRAETGDCALGALCGDAQLPLAAATQADTPRIGGLIKEPRLIEGRAPQYPPVAQAAGASGAVVLEAHVGRDGLVKECRIIEGSRLFDDAALISVRSRRYAPLLLNGVPSDFLLRVTVTFSLRR